MPWPLTYVADPATEAVRARLVAALDLTAADDQADIALVTGPPAAPAAHVILAGPLTDEVDAWDRGLPAQTVAGALWLVPEQPDPESAALAWLLLRLQSPATPLSDLTDTNERALRWSVVAAATVSGSSPEPPAVDEAQVRAWVDEQPQVQELGAAVERIGGDSADAVVAAVDRFRNALAAAGGQAPGSAFDAAVAEHLRQVQRTGFGRWRGGKARAASGAALQEAARQAAAEQVQVLLAGREAEVAAQAQERATDEQRVALREAVRRALDDLQLPAQPDFGKVPRSWTDSAPAARRYVFVPEAGDGDYPDVHATVRPCPQVPPGTVVCALVQSGFSLPAVL